jgi:subtilase family serine protease
LAGFFLAAQPLWAAMNAGPQASQRKTVHTGHVASQTPQIQAFRPLAVSTNLELAITLPLHNQEALNQLLKDLYDPVSPRYHRYLNVEEFTAQFGPTDAEYQQVTAFAMANGLEVTLTHSNRMVLNVRGSVENIQQAFAVSLNVFQHPTESRAYFAPNVEPTVEASLPILSVGGLDNYDLPRRLSTETKPIPRTARKMATGSGPSGLFMGDDFRTAYVPGVSLTGAGQSVALIEFGPYFPADVTLYQTYANRPTVNLTNILVNGFNGTPTSGTDDSEEALDIQMVMSLAPDARIMVYEASSPTTMFNKIATDNAAKSVSVSWGWNPWDPTLDQIFAQMATQGQTILVASGDSGAYKGAIMPPADHPLVTSVGGTRLTTSGAGGVWASETVWSGSSGGISTTQTIPSWQVGVSMANCHGSTSMRNMPDVAMLADTTIFTVNKNGQTGGIGGTSAATPLWAALIALVNQQSAANGGSAVGFINPTIYQLCQTANYSTYFHDITSGNNFNSGSPSLFSAVTGYDLCTGWGSPIGDKLIAYMAGPSDPFQVSPGTGFSARYTNGRPLSVSSLNLTLANGGNTSLDWGAGTAAQWLSLSTSGGSIAASASATVTVNLNLSVISNLTGGSYSTSVLLTNLTTGVAQTRIFGLTVLGHNLPPTLTLQTNQIVVAENSGLITLTNFLSGISAGLNETNQKWTLTLTTATNAATNVMFAKLPALKLAKTSANLSFMGASNSFGTNLLTMILSDNGGTTNGGVNSVTNYVSLGVYWVNQRPLLRGATNRTVFENTATITNVVTVYDVDTANTHLSLSVASSNTTVAGVTIIATNRISGSNATDFTLVYAPQTNQNGKAPITLIASDGSRSTTNQINFVVTPVNQQPSFTLSTNLVLAGENAGIISITNFLTGLRSGPTNEASQSLTFAVSCATNPTSNVLFLTKPTIKRVGANATLTFKSALDSFGTNPVTVVMKDNGGTANGGLNAVTNTFTLGVYWINQPSHIRWATNRAILENSASSKVTIAVFDVDSASSNLSLTATSGNTNLVAITPTLTNALSGTNETDFTFRITPQANQNGKTTITLVASDGTNSTTNSFLLTVTPVNQQPAFQLSTNWLQTLENGGLLTFTNFLTGVTAGPTNETAQKLTFTLLYPTNINTNAIFSVKPAFKLVGSNAHLSFRTATNSFGTNPVTIILTDSGGTNYGGIKAFTNSFVLAVPWVKYTPVLYGLKNLTLLENQTNQMKVPFTIWDPTFTNFTVSATSSDTNVLRVSVASDKTAGTLTLYPVTNTFNTNITVTVGVNDGYATNNTNFASIIVSLLPVNQRPAFRLVVSNINIVQYQVPITVAGAVSNVTPGPINETNQSVSFIVKASNAKLFTVQPAISTNGTLTFTPGAAGGTATVIVAAHDNGGLKNKGLDTSSNQTFTVVIPDNRFTALGGTFTGLFYQTNTLANASSGYLQLKLATNGQFGGYLLCAGASNLVGGRFSAASPTNSFQVTNTTYVLNLELDITTGTETITGSVSNTASHWDSPLLAYLDPFTAKSPTSFAGNYVAAIPGNSSATAGPPGDSVLSLIVSNNGGVSLTGFLADDTPIKQSGLLSRDGHFPMYVSLGSSGSLSGWLGFTTSGPSRLADDSQIVWLEASHSFYPGGFTNSTTALGSTYTTNVSSLFPGPTGTVILSGGTLASPITNLIGFTNNVITSVSNRLSLSIYRPTGQIFGGFFDANGQSNEINSVILQTTNVARGYFIGGNKCGSFLIQGN